MPWMMSGRSTKQKGIVMNKHIQSGDNYLKCLCCKHSKIAQERKYPTIPELIIETIEFGIIGLGVGFFIMVMIEMVSA